MTQLNLDRDPSHIAIKIDFANAFNTIPRKHILQQLYRRPELSGMYPLIFWAYNKPSHLMVHDDKGDVAALLQSKESSAGMCVGIASICGSHARNAHNDQGKPQRH